MLTKSERTRQLIIERAAPVFNRKGYAGTSMSDILEATGLAKGGIYGNFESKDDIAAAAFDYSYQMVLTAVRARVMAERTAAGKLQAIFKFYHNYTVNSLFPGGCPVLNTAVETDDQLPFLKRKAAAAMQEMLQSLQYIIQKGIDTGEFDNRLHAEEEAMLIYSIIEGGIMMSKLSDQPGVLNKLLKHLGREVKQRFMV
ncbi:TetR/AcrR family transcriptional regulator [Taibaiella koreensis]|uniref:TetR/AcrR family transcriptional regulator n=1 Tax=Taibaiella koreensis TaxID=1268548 RepID=UPI000E59D483|nr:TetR/AcrR family transcriptional regulator [Taibaiella koreensis]